MARRPDYDIGELTLTSGSSDFTTSGSSLQTADVQAGDGIITPSGHLLIIASITGQNSGTLFLPCPPDAAGTGLPLRIRFQPDGSRYQGAVRVLIDLLSSGNVEALAGLTGAAGKVPVFTGPGAMDLQDYIADPNGSLGKLAALTLVANKFLRTDTNGDVSQGDITALGAALLGLTGTNGHVPVMTGAGTVASRPIVGTVSQSGGVPSGAIIERGSNANGQFTKFSDGTMECWRTVVSAGTGWKSSGINITFPVAFASGSVPSVQLTSNPPDPGYAGIAEARYVGNTACVIVPPPGITDTGTSAFFGMTVKGRWF